ncbi:MAG: prepilin peptidase [Deltaproteobacteria bacterium]|nr:prepilin peptidase [Deltaproteobacteria bacterium]
MVSLQFAGALVAILACGVGTYTDIKKGVIPNWLTLPTLVLGLIMGFVANSWMGFGMALLSAFATAMVPLILFYMSAMGGGDVKLFAAIGALLGIDLSLQVLMASFMVGALWGIGLWSVRGEIKQRIRVASHKLLPQRLTRIRSETTALSQTYIKFGPAILAGCILTMGLQVVDVVRYGG